MYQSVGEFAAAEGPALQRFAYLLTRNSVLAEDFTQDVLEQLSSRDFAGLHNPRAFARVCLVRRANRYRLRSSLGRQRERDRHSLERYSNEGVTPDTLAERDAIWRLLSRLPVRQRAALVLKYYEDLSDADIADILECKPVTVRSLLSRARSSLRSELQQSEQGTPK